MGVVAVAGRGQDDRSFNVVLGNAAFSKVWVAEAVDWDTIVEEALSVCICSGNARVGGVSGAVGANAYATDVWPCMG